MMGSFDRQQSRLLRAQAEKYSVVVLAKLLDAVDLRVRVDLDAKHPDLVDFLFEHIGRQTVGRDAIAEHSAGMFLCLEDLNLVTIGAQVIRRSQTRWTGANDADSFSSIGRQFRFRVTALGQTVLCRLGLQRTDKDGTVVAAANAGGFARRRTDEAADQRQRVVATDDFNGGTIVAIAEMSHEAGDVDVGRTCAMARCCMGFQAKSLRARLTPDMLFPLLAEVA